MAQAMLLNCFNRHRRPHNMQLTTLSRTRVVCRLMECSLKTNGTIVRFSNGAR
jgi:hypothetical protein